MSETAPPATEKKPAEGAPPPAPPPAAKIKPEELEARVREQDEELGRLRKLEQDSKAAAEDERKKKLSEAEKLEDEKRQLAKEKSQLALERKGVPAKIVPFLATAEDPDKVAKVINEAIEKRANELAAEKLKGTPAGHTIAPSSGPTPAPGGASGSSGGKDTTDWAKRQAEGNRWGKKSGR